MAMLLSLFSESEMMGVSSSGLSVRSSVSSVPSEAPAPSAGVLSEPAPPQVVEVAERLGSDYGLIVNPCVKCRYRGLCDDDDCAMKGFRLDMPHAPTTRGWRRFGF